ncbi:MAG: hypothetical protein IJV75_00175 [Alphaproteobacteria bacterium]|nr:hypothetical protein [Alphaproteobacteria bacterium]
MAKKTQNVVAEEVKAEPVVTEEVKPEDVKAEEVKPEDVKAEPAKAKTEKVAKFTKKQFVTSRKFAKHKDLVNALLDDKKTYSIKEVEDVINNFLFKKK